VPPYEGISDLLLPSSRTPTLPSHQRLSRATS